MRSLQTLLFMLATAVARDTNPICNNAHGLNGDNSISLTTGCSNAKLQDTYWFTVDCDVGSRTLNFGLNLNNCITNHDGKISLQKDGGAFSSCDIEKCNVDVTKGKGASLECYADGCKGKVDLNEAITYNGKYLECFGNLGGDPTRKRSTESLTKRDGPWDKFCEASNFNKFEWDQADLGNELVNRSKRFFDDGPCGKGEYPSFKKYKSFMLALSDRVEGMKSYSGCDANEGCEDIPAVDEICLQDEENPMWLMWMRSIVNYADTMNAIKDAISDSTEYAKTNVTGIAHYYSAHVQKSDSAANWMILSAGLFGGLAAAFGPVSAVAGSAAGIASGMSTVGLGIVNLIGSDDNSRRVQNMVFRGDELAGAMDKIKKDMFKSVDQYGSDLTANPVWHENDPYRNDWYADQKRSLVNIIKDGDFVEKQKEDFRLKFADTITNHVKVGALTWTWNQDKVFWIKISKTFHGTKPCDWPWSSVFKTSAACIDGVAWIAHISKTKNTNGLESFPLEPAGGFDDLAKYNLPDHKALTQAAEDSQKEEGYLKEYTVWDTVGNYPEVPLTKGFNIPVCYLDDLWKDFKIMGQDAKNTNWLLFKNIQRCTTQKDNFGNEFPYKLETSWYDF